MERVQIGTADLYLGDCLEAMREMPDNAFDLAIVDPPYGIDVLKKGTIGSSKNGQVKDYGAKNWDCSIPDQEYFLQLLRVSRNQIVWGGNYFVAHLRNSPCWIVWDKDNSGNFADCELAWTSFDTAVRKYRYRWNGMLQENMRDKETRIHCCQKPVGLYKWLLLNYATSGHTILDTHHGSGSLSIACLDMGFSITAYELDEDYFKAAVERIDRFTQQGKLF